MTSKFKKAKKNIYLILGIFTLGVFVLISIFAGVLSPYDPDMQILEFNCKGIGYSGKVLQKMNSENEIKFVPIQKIIYADEQNIRYIDFEGKEITNQTSGFIRNNDGTFEKDMKFVFGTDNLGRDILSRLIYGGRVSLSVGILAQLISLTIGIILGSLSGYFRGSTDKIIMWLINVVWAFPTILLVISLSVVLGKGLWQAFVAIGLTGWVEVARVIRGQFISLREIEFVESAKALGFSSKRIIFRHILPNCLSSILVVSTVGLATAIIFESSLSFLGLGVQPPTASWGQMIYDGFIYIILGTNWHIAFFPAITIFIVVLFVNLTGDSLRDLYDPKKIN
jgi:ABC-type dipeptide/oligopeptide/nickel transport system permease subunit